MYDGIFRLAPAWVPRAFMIPGRRLKLHPDDLYAFGLERGGINERWFASTTRADNGPSSLPDEGLSYIVIDHDGNGGRILLSDAVALMGDRLLAGMKAHTGSLLSRAAHICTTGRGNVQRSFVSDS